MIWVRLLHHAAKIDINFTKLAELDGVVYDIHSQKTNPKVVMLPRILECTSEDVCSVLCRRVSKGIKLSSIESWVSNIGI